MVRVVEALAPERVPERLTELDYSRGSLLEQLVDSLNDSPPDSPRRLNLSMALVSQDDGQLAYLVDAAAKGTPAEVTAIREVLAPYADSVVDALWQMLSVDGEHVLPCAAALATLDHDNEPKWKEFSPLICRRLTEHRLAAVIWEKSLGQAMDRLSVDLIDLMDATDNADVRTQVASLLLSHLDDPELLAEAVLVSEPEEFRTLVKKFEATGEALQTAEPELKRSLPDQELERERVARRQANAAVLALRAKRTDLVRPFFLELRDPRVQSWIVHLCGKLEVDSGVLCSWLADESDVNVQRGLLVALGGYDPDAINAQARSLAQTLYFSDDAGVRSAAEWVLRKLHAAPQLSPASPAPGREWYVTRAGLHPMRVVESGVEFEMGEPVVDEEDPPGICRHRRRIPRRFALSTREVTVEQFREFAKLHEIPLERGQKSDYTSRYSPTPDCPATRLSWFHAIMYCRWLSEKEDIPDDQQCYPSIAEIKKAAEGLQPLVLPQNYLERTGYRLPTEAEWEYCCRGLAETERCFGNSERLLSDYGWFEESADDVTHPVGSLRPNRLGFFDMHGNLWEWCQDINLKADHRGKEVTIDDVSLPELSWQQPAKDARRAVRGGCYDNTESNIKSTQRTRFPPQVRYNVNAIRVARTMPDSGDSGETGD